MTQLKPDEQTVLVQPSRDEVIAELNRELEMRRVVFSRLVAEGELSSATARWRIGCIERAIELLEAQR